MAKTLIGGNQLRLTTAHALTSSVGFTAAGKFSILADHAASTTIDSAAIPAGLFLSGAVRLSGAPVHTKDAATKAYVDSVAGGAVTTNQIAWGNAAGTGVESASSLWYADGGSTLYASGSIVAGVSLIPALITSASLDFDATAGGITMDATAAISLDGVGTSNFTTNGAMSLSGSTALNLHADSGTIDIDSRLGAITIDSNAAGVSIGAAAASDFTTSAGALTLDGATGILIVGNAAEVDITTTGAVDINSAAGTWDASAAISLDAAAASNFSTSAGSLTLQSHASQLVLSGATVQLSGSGNAVYGVGNSFTDSVSHTFYHGGASLLSIDASGGLAIGSLGIAVNFSAAAGALMPTNFWLTGSATGNGSNAAFEIGSAIANSLQTDDDHVKVHLNGIRQLAGSSDDYMLSSSILSNQRFIKFNTAPVTGDIVLFDYSRSA